MSRSTLRGSAITAEIRKAQAEAAAAPVDPKAAKKNAKDKAAAVSYTHLTLPTTPYV